MLLTIENLGPIKKGSIDLSKKLIILTGPNNTGKSYLTYLIHAISQYESLEGINYITKEVQSIFEENAYINRIVNSGEIVDLKALFLSKADKLSNIITKSVIKNSFKVFASNNISFQLDINLSEDFTKEALACESIFISNNKIHTIINDNDVSDESFSSESFKRYTDIHELTSRGLYILYTITIDDLVGEYTYFFPAERTAINLFAKHIVATKAQIKDELDTEVLASLSNEELGQRLRAQVDAGPKYPYALRSYINFVNSFKRGQEGEFAGIADEMESTITSGKVHLDDLDQIVFTPANSTNSLEIHLTSSLVKSLSYIILYLRYIAKAGHQVIIDEPELNLHPDLQIDIARIISKMVNAGLKVIISTHSDYLIKELNNLILLGELNKKDHHKAFVTEKGFTKAELLTRNQVGAYFLYSDSTGGTIKPINIEEDGLVVPTINDAIHRVDGLAEEVYMEMED